MTVLDQVEWTEEASTSIEQLLNANFSVYCVDSKVSYYNTSLTAKNNDVYINMTSLLY